MPTTMIEIPTGDGACQAEVVTPVGDGPWPAVVLCCDAGGLRPSLTRIAERVAKLGYVVITPNLFHRSLSLSTLVPGELTFAAVRTIFGDPDLKVKFMAGWYLPALDYKNLVTTVGAVLDHLGTRADVKGGIGVIGYCMGGNAAFRVATVFVDRIAAVAAFHPGDLVTDEPDSPHTRANLIKARVYLGPSRPDLPATAEARLQEQLELGHVACVIEQYDAEHGYAVDDSPAYDPAAAERHYAALETLLRETL